MNNQPVGPKTFSDSTALSVKMVTIEEEKFYYVRTGARKGMVVWTIKKTLGMPGVWWCRTPWGKVVTVQMNAKSSVTDNPISGVKYESHPLTGIRTHAYCLLV